MNLLYLKGFLLLPLSAVVSIKHLAKLLKLGSELLLGGPDGDAVHEELAVLGDGGGHGLVRHGDTEWILTGF